MQGASFRLVPPAWGQGHGDHPGLLWLSDRVAYLSAAESQGQEKGCGQGVARPAPKGVRRAPPGASPSVWPNLGRAGSLSRAEGPQGPEKLVSTLVPSEQSCLSHGDLLKGPSVWRPRLCSSTAHTYPRTAHRWVRSLGSGSALPAPRTLPGTPRPAWHGPSQHCSPAHLAF